MCTYDYTPYTGCKDGQQHFYIQWVKCNKAVQTNRYCPLEESTELEHLKKLSTNVLSCPIHGAVAVQQHVFQFVSAEAAEAREELPVEDQGPGTTDRPRARMTAYRDNTPSTRRDLNVSSSRDVERPVRQEARKRRPARKTVPVSSDSESDGHIPVRPKTVHGSKRQDERGPSEKRASSLARDSDKPTPRRGSLPPLHHARSEASLPHEEPQPRQQPETSGPTQSTSPTTNSGGAQTRPKSALTIPHGTARIGLPSSPDILRLAAIHKSKSEALLRPGHEESPSSSPSTASDSSPDHNPELPFSSSSGGGGSQRRGRRAGAPLRSTRNRSVERGMGRIDEHVLGGGGGEGEHKEGSAPESSPAVSLSGDSPAASSSSSPTEQSRAEGRGWPAAATAATSPSSSPSSRSPATAGPSPVLTKAGRESVDSGYRSQQGGYSPGGGGPGAAVGLGITISTSSTATGPAGASVGIGLGVGQGSPGGQRQPRVAPAPLGLGTGGLPPCALPVELALLSPGYPQPSAAKGGKVPLLERMGLRKKLSGLWEKGGRREVGAVEG